MLTTGGNRLQLKVEAPIHLVVAMIPPLRHPGAGAAEMIRPLHHPGAGAVAMIPPLRHPGAGAVVMIRPLHPRRAVATFHPFHT
jgi:hypothetical protein